MFPWKEVIYVHIYTTSNIQYLKGLKANTLLCISKYIFAFIT